MTVKNEQLNKSAFTYHTALVDWFRFTCLWEDDLSAPSEMTRKVFDLLKVNLGWVSDSRSNALCALGYKRTFVYESDVKVGVDPFDKSKMVNGSGQFVVDLSGSACRHFEVRGGDWAELICGLSELPVRFNRVDLAMDDIDGYFEVEELKRKIHNQEFVSAFRACKANGKVCDETYVLAMPDEDDLAEYDGEARVIDSRKGYTATFGSRASSVMLNVYDKKAEREVNASGADVSEWVRFEASFLRHKCEAVVRKLVVPALKNGSFGKVVAGVLRGLIEFKDCSGSALRRSNDRSNHMNRLPVWKPYKDFIGDVQAIKVPVNQSKVEESVARTKRWAEGYWNQSLLKLFACSDCAYSDVIYNLKKRVAEEGIPYSILSQSLNYYLQVGRHSVTVSDVLDMLQVNFDMYDVAGGNCENTPVEDYRFDENGVMENVNSGVSSGREHVDVRGAFVYRLSKDWNKLDNAIRAVVRFSVPFVDDLPVFSGGASV